MESKCHDCIRRISIIGLFVFWGWCISENWAQAATSTRFAVEWRWGCRVKSLTSLIIKAFARSLLVSDQQYATTDRPTVFVRCKAPDITSPAGCASNRARRFNCQWINNCLESSHHFGHKSTRRLGHPWRYRASIRCRISHCWTTCCRTVTVRYGHVSGGAPSISFKSFFFRFVFVAALLLVFVSYVFALRFHRKRLWFSSMELIISADQFCTNYKLAVLVSTLTWHWSGFVSIVIIWFCFNFYARKQLCYSAS